MTQHIILTETSPHSLANEITIKIQEGWQRYGHMTITQGYSCGWNDVLPQYHQQMEKNVIDSELEKITVDTAEL